MLSEAQMRRIEPYFPLSHGIPRVDDRLIVSGIIYVIKNGLRWRDAPRSYGPHKTIYNRLFAGADWACSTAFFAELAGQAGEPDRIMIKATHLKTPRAIATHPNNLASSYEPYWISVTYVHAYHQDVSRIQQFPCLSA